ncbi:hypothetical protein CRG98_005258 [Punica granatum]|uniref:Uncharacterized protein n=1 Tax=Punica granatum TaxID=22663 RepID=A0A2I0L0X9_PUNGR|nr:hypothetical protein CRG98_005258 [Punica granatum]
MNFLLAPSKGNDVTEPCPGLIPVLLYMLKEFILMESPPLGLHQSLGPYQFGVRPLSPPSGLNQSLAPHQHEVGLHPMKCTVHGNCNHGNYSLRASMLKTSEMKGSLENPIACGSNSPPKPGGSLPAPELDLVLGVPGVSSASGKEEDLTDLDLLLHL